MVTRYKLERVKKGLTQSEVAEKTGLKQTRVSLIERGIFPKPEEKRALEKFYGANE